ncbi:hypothetical protein BpHYR1_004778 [Brachionus plicatilis]|uniref:Uncharacterized protein n=1 Tax=Brachionus plicatilis TaxID=10195 RepID=A0A3M7SZJ2_BRAPC|nr:hypothetical protein BpHYR1_004778 [Brachionus plicatilis]
MTRHQLILGKKRQIYQAGPNVSPPVSTVLAEDIFINSLLDPSIFIVYMCLFMCSLLVLTEPNRIFQMEKERKTCSQF